MIFVWNQKTWAGIWLVSATGISEKINKSQQTFMEQFLTKNKKGDKSNNSWKIFNLWREGLSNMYNKRIIWNHSERMIKLPLKLVVDFALITQCIGLVKLSVLQSKLDALQLSASIQPAAPCKIYYRVSQLNGRPSHPQCLPDCMIS